MPEEKLVHMREMVTSWLGRCSGRFKELESLLGHLSHAATVIRDGQIFLRHLFSLLSVARSCNHFIHLDQTGHADLYWWACFLQHWNGRSFLPRPGATTLHVYTDASGSFGCGGVMLPGDWFQIQWPQSWAEVDISTKELVPIVVGAALWGGAWASCCVQFHTAVVAMLQGHTARHSTALHLLRCFTSMHLCPSSDTA